MAQTLRVEQFESAINAVLRQYKGLVDADVEAVTKEVGRRAVQNVKANIGAAHINGTAYRNSISVRNSRDGANLRKAVIYSKAPHYRLTHLLEFGHAVVLAGGRTPGPGKMTRTKARPHWSAAEREAIAEFETRLKEAIANK